MLVGAPAGALIGAMMATAAASIVWRRRLGLQPPLYAVLLCVAGASAGASFTPEALRAAVVWPLSILFLAAATAALCAAGYAVFRKLGGCDHRTAFYAAAPGALAAVLALGEASGADMSKVALAQTLRLSALAAAAPFALAAAGAGQAAAPVESGLIDWGLILIAVAGGWAAAERLKWPAPAFLGPLLGSAAIHASGLSAAAPPPAVLAVAMTGLGAVVGTRFAGVTPAALLRFLPAAGLALAAMAAVGLTCGWIAGTLAGVGGAAGMIAFAPGGMETMVLIAVALNAEPAYVAAHHLTRLLSLFAVLPWLARRVTPS